MTRSHTVEDQLAHMAQLVPAVRRGSVPDLHRFEVMASSLLRNADDADRAYVAHRIGELRFQFAGRDRGNSDRSTP